jgi:glycosyltransferase involved in cell wall biosynthesis
MATISAVIMTLNEEHNIEYALRSVRPWCDEVIVVDMMSDDRTQEIAGRYVDRLLTHERVGFVEPARRVGFAAAKGDWVINIDADEVVSPGLASRLRELADSNPPYDVVLVPRINVYLGRWLRHTPWWPGKPRFFRNGQMQTSTRIHHGFQPREGARIGTIERDPKKSLWHFSYTSLASVTDKFNRYSSVEAEQAIEDGGGDPRFIELLRSPLRPLGTYLTRGGFRDGFAGLFYAVSMSFYGFMRVAKRWDHSRVARRQSQYDRMKERLLAGFENEQGFPGERRA